MSSFRPIASPEDLPAFGTREHVALDFKAKANGDAVERAKDMAAFANASGGTLLIGAQDTDDKLVGWVPMRAEDAQQVVTLYEEAIALCTPAPRVDLHAIQKDETHWPVAVNVYPFPGVAVGVRTLSLGDKSPYVFPWRSATHTHYLRPDQLPMLMLPKLRYIVAQLEQIPRDGDVKVIDTKEHSRSCRLLDVLPLENIVIVELVGGKRRVGYTVPLDYVLSVWKDRTAGWCIRIGGHFVGGRFAISE